MAKRLLLLIAVVTMMIGVAVSVSAADTYSWSSTYCTANTVLTGNLGNVIVDASAVLDGEYWYYTYVLSPTNILDGSGQATGLAGQLHSFSIGNSSLLAYDQSASDDTTFEAKHYADTIRWQQMDDATSATKDPITFTFRSIYAPTVVDCSAQNSGHVSYGRTLGLAVPEPMSLALGCLGLVSIGGFRKLRRK
ncbi:MAG: hypothetical protein ABFD49_05025 [Armatimonadota bacterium]